MLTKTYLPTSKIEILQVGHHQHTFSPSMMRVCRANEYLFKSPHGGFGNFAIILPMLELKPVPYMFWLGCTAMRHGHA